MASLGTLPDNISLLHALDSIGENVLIADTDYTITWMNSNASRLFSHIAPLYNITDVNEMIGMNMNAFHKNPARQEGIMETLTHEHRARINIRELFIADIVITPIKETGGRIEGYIVMLQDVTTKAEEEKRKEAMIEAMSVPMMSIWDKTISLPLVGEFTEERGSRMTASVLRECTENNLEYVLIAMNGIREFDETIRWNIQQLVDCLKLVGTECVLVGIKPSLAMTMRDFDPEIRTFSSAYQGLQYIMKKQAEDEK